jgi:MoxR-like ATPase
MLGKEAPEKVLVSGRVKQIITPELLAKLRESLEEILVKEELSGYIVDIVRRTRRHPSVLVGAGPRATQSLILAGRTHAAINGRDFITPDDIKTMALPVLEHRLILRPEYEIEGLTVGEVIGEILKEIAVPR